ncbi:MAG: hypothetical protein GY953_25380 [bacterium]|nr:hypothetical protein [bacterium]
MRQTKWMALILALLLALSLAAQDRPEPIQKIFQIQHADPMSVANIIQVFPAHVQHDKSLRTISVRATPEIMEAIEESIKRFDRPQPPRRNIELTFHMLLASRKSAAGALPAELTAVEKQLKSLFGFQSLTLMETSVIRMRDGSVEGGANGSLAFPAEIEPPHPATYSLSIYKAGISASNGANAIRLDRLRLRVSVPYRTTSKTKDGFVEESWNIRDAASLSTDIDVKEGQKVVVGKANLDGAERNLILVVTAKVLE